MLNLRPQPYPTVAAMNPASSSTVAPPTPAERAAIDHPPATHATAAPPPRLDGIVSPRSGTPTLFVDGRARPAIPQQIRLDEASAEVPGPDGRRHRLRVGAPPDAPTP